MKPGDEFRDLVATLLRTVGYEVRTEVLVAGKVVDVLASRRIQFGSEKIALETKEYKGNLPLDEANQFAFEYGTLGRDGHVSRAILVTRGDLTPQGKEAIRSGSRNGILHFTWESFQREVFGPDRYLRKLAEEFKEDGIEQYYIKPNASQIGDLETFVRSWMHEKSPGPLVILGEYGTGKSTFARALTNSLAADYFANPSARLPILVPLGDIAEETSLEGLFGKLLSARYRIDGYHYEAFRELNRLGRLLIVLDGLDEMKHGMTFPVFQRECRRLFSLQEGDARLLILGRPNAFASDQEFRAVIKGRVTTATGDEIALPGTLESRVIRLTNFDEEGSRSFVSRYLSWLASKQGRPKGWIEHRVLDLQSQQFAALIRRPVHAQMLCQIAADPHVDLAGIDEFKLYDLFITLLLHREVAKPGRFAGFEVTHRRKFNGAVSWWLMTHGGASATTIYTVPSAFCNSAASGVAHDFDAEGLKRELVAGCLVEKGGDRVYFGHRSIQEFLAAEFLCQSDFGSRELGDLIAQICAYSSPEVVEFLREFFTKRPDGKERATRWCAALAYYQGDLPLADLGPFIVAYEHSLKPMHRLTAWDFLLRYAHSTAGRSSSNQVDYLLGAIGNAYMAKDAWLAAVQQIVIEAKLGKINSNARLLATLIGKSRLLELIERAQITGRTVEFQPEDYRSFCLLASLRSDGHDNSKTIFDLDYLGRAARHILKFGPVMRTPEESDPDGMFWPVSPDAVYSNLGWSDADLNRIRHYFGDTKLRSLLRPIEVAEFPSRFKARSSPSDY